MSPKERIDNILVANGLAESTAAAKAMVMAGIILVDDKRIEKSSEMFPPDAVVRIKGDSPASKYVGRGGLKLEEALSAFHIRPDACICLDVGSSTGGFTDCLLQNGAARVVAVDTGTNQIDWKLRTDPRVDVRENTNARDLSPDDLGEQFDLIVMDVSFISVRIILPALVPLMKPAGAMIVLIKPQFEVGRSEVGDGGIVKDPLLHERVVQEVNSFAETCGLEAKNVIDSPILGAKGNKEFLVHYERQRKSGK